MAQSLRKLMLALFAGALVLSFASDNLSAQTYTDLFDFCVCLRTLIEKSPKDSAGTSDLMETIQTTCDEVLVLLAAGKDGDDVVMATRRGLSESVP